MCQAPPDAFALARFPFFFGYCCQIYRHPFYERVVWRSQAPSVFSKRAVASTMRHDTLSAWDSKLGTSSYNIGWHVTVNTICIAHSPIQRAVYQPPYPANRSAHLGIQVLPHCRPNAAQHCDVVQVAVLSGFGYREAGRGIPCFTVLCLCVRARVCVCVC